VLAKVIWPAWVKSGEIHCWWQPACCCCMQYGTCLMGTASLPLIRNCCAVCLVY